MKITYISTKFPPVAGGAGSAAYTLAEALSKKHEITVITEWEPGLKTNELQNNVKIERIKANPKSITGNLSFVTQAAISASRKKADIIHLHDVTSGICNVFMSKVTKTKKIMKYGGDFAYEYLSLRNVKGWDPARGVSAAWSFNTESKFAAWLQKHYLKRCDIVYSNSEYGVRLLEQIGIKKDIPIVPNGINLKLFDPKKYDCKQLRSSFGFEGSVIFAPARLMPWKGIDVLIEAFRRIDNKDCMLVIAGDGREKPRLQALAAGDSRIKFVGSIAWQKMPLYLSASDIFAMPSLFEWCPNALLEAMAMEKIAVASHVGGIPEIINDKKNGFLVEPKNVSDLGEKLQAAIEKSKKNTGNIRKSVETKYSPEQMIRKVEKLYEAVSK